MFTAHALLTVPANAREIEYRYWLRTARGAVEISGPRCVALRSGQRLVVSDGVFERAEQGAWRQRASLAGGEGQLVLSLGHRSTKQHLPALAGTPAGSWAPPRQLRVSVYAGVTLHEVGGEIAICRGAHTLICRARWLPSTTCLTPSR
jgi:hypothetical protein